MGIGDRGERRGSQVRSMAVAPAMISAQRDAARRPLPFLGLPVRLWAARMQWCSGAPYRLMNKDYIHLTHKGEACLAGEPLNAIQHDLK